MSVASSSGQDLLKLLLNGSGDSIVDKKKAKTDEGVDKLASNNDHAASFGVTADSSADRVAFPSSSTSNINAASTSVGGDESLDDLFRTVTRKSPWGNVSPSAVQHAQRERKISGSTALLGLLNASGSNQPTSSATRSSSHTFSKPSYERLPSTGAGSSTQNNDRQNGTTAAPLSPSVDLSAGSKTLLAMLNIKPSIDNLKSNGVTLQASAPPMHAAQQSTSTVPSKASSPAQTAAAKPVATDSSSCAPDESLMNNLLSMLGSAADKTSVTPAHQSTTNGASKSESRSVAARPARAGLIPAGTIRTPSPSRTVTMKQRDASNSPFTFVSPFDTLAARARTQSPPDSPRADNAIFTQLPKRHSLGKRAMSQSLADEHEAQRLKADDVQDMGHDEASTKDSRLSSVTESSVIPVEVIDGVQLAKLSPPITYGRQPIARFKAAENAASCRQIAANGLIAYATRAGRIRIIDPATGSRILAKVHSGASTCIAISAEGVERDGTTWRHIASVKDNELVVIRVPATFSVDGTAHEIVLRRIDAPMTLDEVVFHPRDPHVFVVVSRKHGALRLSTAKLPSDASTRADFWPSSSLRYLDQPFDNYISPSFRSTDAASLDITMSSQLSGASFIRHALTSSGDRFERCETLHATSAGAGSSETASLPSLLSLRSSGGTRMTYAAIEGVVQIWPDSQSDDQQTQVRLPKTLLRFNDSPSSNLSVLHDSDMLVYSSPNDTTAYVIKTSISDDEPITDTVRIVDIEHEPLQLLAAHIGGQPCLLYLHAEGFEQLILEDLHVETHDDSAVADLAAASVNGHSEAKREVEAAQADASAAPDASHAAAPSPPIKQESVSPKLPSSEASLLLAPTTESQDAQSELLNRMQGLFIEQAALFDNAMQTQQRAEKARTQQATAIMTDTIQSVIHSKLSETLQLQVAAQIEERIEQRLLPELLRNFSVLTTAVQQATQSSRSSDNDVQRLQDALTASVADHMRDQAAALATAVQTALSAAVTDLDKSQTQSAQQTLNAMASLQSQTLQGMRDFLMQSEARREQEQAQLRLHLQQMQQTFAASFTQQQAQLERMQAMLSNVHDSQAGQQASMSGPQAYPQPQYGSDNASTTQRSERLQRNDIIRPETPREQYEDLFLRTLMQGDTDPLPILVDQAPPTRLSRVLPQGAPPLISAPSVMTLCLRLARYLRQDTSPELGDLGRKRMAWLLSCIQSTYVARHDSRYAAYLPRIFTDTLNGLSERRRHLQLADDLEAIEAVLRAVDALAVN